MQNKTFKLFSMSSYSQTHLKLDNRSTSNLKERNLKESIQSEQSTYDVISSIA